MHWSITKESSFSVICPSKQARMAVFAIDFTSFHWVEFRSKESSVFETERALLSRAKSAFRSGGSLLKSSVSNFCSIAAFDRTGAADQCHLTSL